MLPLFNLCSVFPPFMSSITVSLSAATSGSPKTLLADFDSFFMRNPSPVSYCDETKSLLLKQTSGGDKRPVQKKQLQFGSLNFETGGSLTGASGKSSNLLNSPKAPASIPSSDSHKCNGVNKVNKVGDKLPGVSRKGSDTIPSPDSHKCNGVNSINTVSDNLSCVSGPIKGNGSIANLSFGPSTTIKEKEVKEVSYSAPYDVDGPLNQFENLKLDGSETGNLKHVNENGSLDQDTKKASNGHVAIFKDILPRGLINSGNLCFLNATMQALLSCSPFVQLLQELKNRENSMAGYPTLTAFAEFIAQFDMPINTTLKKKDPASLEMGRPFCPIMFEGVLKNFTPDVPNSMSGRPRQEDAQEFLSFVMDQMHDELLKLEGHSSSTNGGKSSIVCSVEDDEWETVGPKNKSAVTRTQSFLPSELSDIFGGQLRSLVRARGNPASATIQPYLLLHLDIYPDAVNTIEDALHLFSMPENLEGFRTSYTGKAGIVTARKSVQIQKLSKIMILHLMRFSYGSQGSTKLHKPVHFPLELVLGRDLLVSPSTEGRKYELVATITHHGREPSKGHYTADARYPNGQWLRFDDASVFAIGANKVLHDQAYVLFYKQFSY
ncbi:ubiquitin carboxyl-terminal hydrolase 24 [Senna tora]|uniref:Ubiquitin carboxyl-terminal hydrolase n=1 Tax=Senna tora TaxID=362788 RepID=A0A834WJ37_9FABA|nr:ubiquitin carboxyl-terminal hydrolase 24 [Senna tora]